jgi:glycine dehydrogenase subunit 1
MGPEGLRKAALASHQNMHALKEKLLTISGVETVFASPTFHEIVFRLPVSVDAVLEKLAKQNIQGGFSLRKFYPELGECLLVCVTETKTPEDLENFAKELRSVIENLFQGQNQKKSKVNGEEASCHN